MEPGTGPGWLRFGRTRAGLAVAAAGAVLLGVAGVAHLEARDALEARLDRFGFSRQTAQLAVPARAVERAVTPPARPPAQPSPTPTPAPEEIAAGVGFTPKAPGYLPPGYRQLGGFELMRLEGVATRRVVWRAMPERRERLCVLSLTLMQEPAAAPPPIPYPIGAAAASAVSVAGAPGLLIEQVQAGSCTGGWPDGRTESAVLVANLLAWEADGVRYRLMADAAVDRTELVRIAESVG